MSATSSDRNAASVRDSVQIVRISCAGEAGPCPARNDALLRSEADWVLLLDDDAEPTEGCLEALLDEARNASDVGAVVPRVKRREASRVIHYDGAQAHFLGETAFQNHWTSLEAAREPGRELGAASTTAVLLCRRAAIEAGLFDASIAFFREDLDFYLRLRRAGWRLRLRSDAVVLHGGRERGPLHARRTRWQARNRWLVLVKIFSLRSLVLTMPAQLAYELVGLVGDMSRGRAIERLRGLVEAVRLAPRSRAPDGPRRVPDSALFGAPELSWSPEVLATPGAQSVANLVSAAAAAYWRAVAPWLR